MTFCSRLFFIASNSSSAFLRCVTSCRITVRICSSSSCKKDIEASAGNSSPFMRDPDTEHRSPALALCMRRCKLPRWSLRDSSGMSNSIDCPISCASLLRNMTREAGLADRIFPSAPSMMIASIADSMMALKRRRVVSRSARMCILEVMSTNAAMVYISLPSALRTAEAENRTQNSSPLSRLN